MVLGEDGIEEVDFLSEFGVWSVLWKTLDIFDFGEKFVEGL